jgi:hypothetical protein
MEDEIPQRFNYMCMPDPNCLANLVCKSPTINRVRFGQIYCHRGCPIEIEDPQPFLALLEDAINENHMSDARTVVRFPIDHKHADAVVPYFSRSPVDCTLVFALCSMFKPSHTLEMRKHVSLDTVSDILRTPQMILDTKLRYFIEKYISDDDTLLHEYLWRLESTPRNFCLTTHSVASLNWDDIRRHPDLFACCSREVSLAEWGARHFIKADRAFAGIVCLRRATGPRGI